MEIVNTPQKYDFGWHILRCVLCVVYVDHLWFHYPNQWVRWREDWIGFSVQILVQQATVSCFQWVWSGYTAWLYRGPFQIQGTSVGFSWPHLRIFPLSNLLAGDMTSSFHVQILIVEIIHWILRTYTVSHYLRRPSLVFHIHWRQHAC